MDKKPNIEEKDEFFLQEEEKFQKFIRENGDMEDQTFSELDEDEDYEYVFEDDINDPKNWNSENPTDKKPLKTPEENDKQTKITQETKNIKKSTEILQKAEEDDFRKYENNHKNPSNNKLNIIKNSLKDEKIIRSEEIEKNLQEID